MTTVLAAGVFDLLHYGHIRYLEEAKKAGGPGARLVVIVARDETVKRQKGTEPIIPEDQRRAVIEALKVVDEALLGFEDIDLDRVLQQVKPDIVVVGHDQEAIKAQVEKINKAREMKIKLVQAHQFGEDDLNSTSKIKRRIVEGAKTRP
ncbi:FAD synthase [Candidatus Bathyarchaeota archaeon]|jgi:FAD synthetase|nr:FAD synthase [Candidatus Bathyarchaeota archaeon]